MKFEYSGLPSNVVFGVGTAEGHELTRRITEIGARRLLLVAAAADAALADPIADVLGNAVVGRFSDVAPHVPLTTARAARAAARACAADAVLSVGGGSTTGAAKAIALELELPIIAVPTTYAGSEVTPVWGLTEDGRKTTGLDRRVLPTLVIYDPGLTVSLPPALTVASGLNALAHCVEAFWAPGRNPITSLLAEEGMRAFAAGLPDVRRDPSDIEARERCLYGAWLAGVAFARAGSDVHHKTCHVLGGTFDLPHAETHAVVLPHATAAVMAARAGMHETGTRIATALGAGPDTPAAEAILAFAHGLDAPRSLAEIGLREIDLTTAIERVGDTLGKLPESPDATAADALVTAAYRGSLPSAEVEAS